MKKGNGATINWEQVEAAEAVIRRAEFDEYNQAQVCFADVCTELEVTVAARELGYEAEQGNGDGNWWIYKEQ